MDPQENTSSSFARLKPHNKEACKAFSNVVDKILNHPLQFEHYRKFNELLRHPGTSSFCT